MAKQKSKCRTCGKTKHADEMIEVRNQKTGRMNKVCAECITAE